MRHIAQINEDGFCFAVGMFPEDYTLRADQIDVTDNPLVTGMYYRDRAWHAAEQPAPEPTQLDNIERVQLTMMEAMADQYEESQDRELTNMDVLATMYEEILSIKGEK